MADEDDELSLIHTVNSDEAESISPIELSEQETQDAASVHAPAVIPKPRIRKYIEVDETTPQHEEPDHVESRWYTAATWVVLLASLLGIVGFIAVSLKPPNADELFARISAAIETGDDNQLLEHRDDVRQFVLRFPADERSEALRELALELDESQRTRRVEARLRRGHRSGDASSPLEEKLLETMSLERSNPMEAAIQYKALIDLFGDEQAEQTQSEVQCLRIAEQRRNQILRQQQANAATFQARIRQRLSEAERLDATDPEAAERIRQAILRLYAIEPWAAETVEQVRSQLRSAEVNEDYLSTESSLSE